MTYQNIQLAHLKQQLDTAKKLKQRIEASNNSGSYTDNDLGSAQEHLDKTNNTIGLLQDKIDKLSLTDIGDMSSQKDVTETDKNATSIVSAHLGMPSHKDDIVGSDITYSALPSSTTKYTMYLAIDDTGNNTIRTEIREFKEIITQFLTNNGMRVKDNTVDGKSIYLLYVSTKYTIGLYVQSDTSVYVFIYENKSSNVEIVKNINDKYTGDTKLGIGDTDYTDGINSNYINSMCKIIDNISKISNADEDSVNELVENYIKEITESKGGKKSKSKTIRRRTSGGKSPRTPKSRSKR